jgi:hypothetical protein
MFDYKHNNGYNYFLSVSGLTNFSFLFSCQSYNIKILKSDTRVILVFWFSKMFLAVNPLQTLIKGEGMGEEEGIQREGTERMGGTKTCHDFWGKY